MFSARKIMLALAGLTVIFWAVLWGTNNAQPQQAPGGSQGMLASDVNLRSPALKLTTTSYGKVLLTGLTTGSPKVVPVCLISPDGRHIAVAVRDETGTCVSLDGKPGKQYMAVEQITFSPDSKRLAYAALTDRDNKHQPTMVVVVDGEEKAVKGWVESLTFSPDSKHVVWTSTKVVAGTEGHRRQFYDHWLVVDGEETTFKDGFAPYGVRYSPDSKHMAYVSGDCVILDGKAGEKYDYIVQNHWDLAPSVKWLLSFSPDSQHFAYCAVKEKKRVMILDGKEIEDVNLLPIWSPDSKHVAYKQSPPKKVAVVRDGVEGKGYWYMGCISYSPDSKHLAYFARNEAGWFLVLDGKEHPVQPYAEELIWSPDSKTVTYIGASALYVDGTKKELKYPITGIAFSPDSQHTAIATHILDTQWKACIVLDGVTLQNQFERIGTLQTEVPPRTSYRQHAPAFSPDAKYLAYFGSDGEKYNLCLNKTAIALDVMPFTPPTFDAPDKLHFLAVKGNEVFLVEIEIAK